MAFVVFEGIDGAGKTSLIQRLCRHLQETRQDYVLTREPGGTGLGDAIRALLLNPHGDAPVPRAELLLYEAGRAQHVDRLIRPALQEGKWVICDRFTGSTVAFQAHGRHLDMSGVEWLNQFATGGLLPDLTVLLDLDAHEGQRRRETRSQKCGQELDRFERENLLFHQTVREAYLRQARASQNSDRPWLVLDATQSEAMLFQQLCQDLEKRQWPVS
jgi:dTMP kinase